jgi:hypothetical protein
MWNLIQSHLFLNIHYPEPIVFNHYMHHDIEKLYTLAMVVHATAKHIKLLQVSSISSKHTQQIQWVMTCSGDGDHPCGLI